MASPAISWLWMRAAIAGGLGSAQAGLIVDQQGHGDQPQGDAVQPIAPPLPDQRSGIIVSHQAQEQPAPHQHGGQGQAKADPIHPAGERPGPPPGKD